MKLPGRVTICEVGTRDGFQIEPDFIGTELKIEVVDRLSEAGVPRIEVTSFVHPKVVPQLRDAEMVMPNILAAMEYGVTHFDSSIGGLGGCPFAPGASGNVCSEDLVHCLHAMEIDTGIDLDRLVAVSRRVQEIVGRALPGQIVKAGKSDRRYPVPDGVSARLPTPRP